MPHNTNSPYQSKPPLPKSLNDILPGTLQQQPPKLPLTRQNSSIEMERRLSAQRRTKGVGQKMSLEERRDIRRYVCPNLNHFHPTLSSSRKEDDGNCGDNLNASGIPIGSPVRDFSGKFRQISGPEINFKFFWDWRNESFWSGCFCGGCDSGGG